MPEIIFATSTIDDGNMAERFGAPEKVRANRTRFLKTHALSPKNCISMRCTHGETIIPVNWGDVTGSEESIEAEVLVTKEKGLTLMLTTADCLPMGFYDSINGVIALAHVSRVTTTLSLAAKTVAFMAAHYGTKPHQLRVLIGPNITSDSYRFPLPLQHVHSVLASHIKEKAGYAHIDLLGANTKELNQTGILSENISVSPIDTATSLQHFSHYKSTMENCPEGRIATVLSLR